MKDKLKKVLNEYGEEGQANQFAQECAELIVALTKYDKENIKEEIADVKVMIEQFKMFEAIRESQYAYECIREFYNNTLDLNKECVIETLECALAKVIFAIKKESPLKAVLNTAILEINLKKYIEFKNIDNKEIEKIIDYKIKRQLKRIEDRKRNRFLNKKIN